MTLLALTLCAVALATVAVSIYGPRRWHRNVTTAIRPDAPEPDVEGYALLTKRNWLIAVPLVVIAAWVTLDVTRTSDEELKEAVEVAVAQLDGTVGEIDGDRIGVLVEEALGAEVSVVQIELDDDGREDPPVPAVAFEVTAGSTDPQSSHGEVPRWGGTAPLEEHSHEAVTDRSVICIRVSSQIEQGLPISAHSHHGHCQGDLTDSPHRHQAAGVRAVDRVA